MDRYQMVLGDCAGPYLEVEVQGFEALLAVVEQRRESAGAMVCFNLDRCDGESDGLTYPESEAISIVQQGRGIAEALAFKAEEEACGEVAPAEYVEMGGEA